MMGESQYEIRVSHNVNSDGYYIAAVYVDGVAMKYNADEDRARAIERAKVYVEWHRNFDPSEEVIAL